MYRFKLKFVGPRYNETTGYHFYMDSPFIPLQVLSSPVSSSFGKLDGKELGPRGLQMVFEQYEAIQTMLQNILFVDLNEFLLRGAVYRHNAAELDAYDPASNNMVLYYLEPVN